MNKSISSLTGRRQLRVQIRLGLERCLEILQQPVDSVRVSRCVGEAMGQLFPSALNDEQSGDDSNQMEGWPSIFAQAVRLYGLRAETGQMPIDRIPEMASNEKPIVISRLSRKPTAGRNAPLDQNAPSELAIISDFLNNRVKIEPTNGSPPQWVGIPSLRSDDPESVEETFVAVSLRTRIGGQSSTGGHDSHDAGNQHHDGSMPPLRRFLEMIRSDWRDIRVVLIFSFFVAMLSLAAPITTAALVNSVQGGSAIIVQVMVLTSVLFFCLALAGCMRALKAWVVEYLQQRVFVRVADDLSYRLPLAKINAFDGQNGLELVNRFFDVLTVQKAGAVLLVDGLTVLVNSFAGMIILGFYSRFLLGFDIALIGAMVLFIWILGIGAVRTSINESLAKYRVAGWLEEVMRNPISFRGWGGHELARARTDSLTQQYLLARKEHFRILFRQICFSLGLQALASSALLGLGGWLVTEGQLSIGQLVAAELIVSVIVGSAVKLTKSLESYYDLMAAMNKLGQLFDLPLEREGGETLAHLNTGASIVIKGWTPPSANNHGAEEHHHHSSHETPFHLNILAGEKVALSGATGAGKSLLLQTLVGLRDPKSGTIQVDGIDLRQLDLAVLREQVVLVSGHEIVEGTVFENIRMGRPEITPDMIRHVLRQVGLETWVADLPRGWDSTLVSGGSILSSGETIQILLARAIVGQPRLLLLDGILDGLASPLREYLTKLVTSREKPWSLLLITNDHSIAGLCDREIAMGDTSGEDHS